MASSKRLTWSVTRKTPELLCPAESTPHEIKHLSDIDDQASLRCYVTSINFFKNNPSMEGKDPVKIIREAIAKALVFYYPLAGRLREHTGRKLVVECTGQGVVFNEADADATLQHFEEDGLYPPFPNLDAITLDVPNKLGILGGIPHMFIKKFFVAWYSGFKDGFVVPVSLPLESMRVFEKHLQVMTTTAPTASSL